MAQLASDPSAKRHSIGIKEISDELNQARICEAQILKSSVREYDFMEANFKLLLEAYYLTFRQNAPQLYYRGIIEPWASLQHILQNFHVRARDANYIPYMMQYLFAAPCDPFDKTEFFRLSRSLPRRVSILSLPTTRRFNVCNP